MIANIRALASLAAVVSLALSAAACAAPMESEETPNEDVSVESDLASRSAFFESFEGADGQFYFHLMAMNGENVLRSEGYATLEAAEKGAAAVLANGHDKRNFEMRAASNGDAYFVVKAQNNEIIGTSELYASKANAERGAATVRRLVRLSRAATALQVAPKRERFELFLGEDGKSYFRVRAGNGEIVLGSQGYTTKQGAQKGIASVITNGADASAYQVFEAGDAYGVRLVAKNGEVIARGELYASKSNASRAVARLSEMLRGGLPTE